MSRSSPGVRRVVAILNFFADHPGQTFTLTDLVRALKLSRATCHGLLAGLVDAGYLYRTSDKSYLLGPALVAIGEGAKAHFSPLQAAQPEMRVLADAFDLTCSATFRERTDVVIRERATAVSHLGNSVPRGTRLPLAPQFASLFFPWAPQAEVDAWLEEVEPAPSPEQIDAMRQGIAFIRENGFLFSIRNPSVEGESGSSDWLQDSRYENTPVLPQFALNPDADYRLVFVQTPVLDARRQVAFVIGLQGYSRLYKGSEVQTIGQRLCEARDRISAFITHAPTAREQAGGK
ncbi:helix-turn-helix domain-containing protein [Sphingobium sufflavum]|uniref:IclR family transcriptional regulator n=1 Tax=Sphingobium sufflavum TaxID=1129547 RepID=UPI001F181868|nr:helix-turn-helix domain-containing protein [Sphingobium sufflavum]MCE7795438.1 helix-turn-helix domain-containing protein [Sphingobium sufflavum]